MAKILLISHGPLASAMLESCSMLFGRSENLKAVCLNEEDSAEALKLKIFEEVEKVEDKNEIILIVDIAGGTPANMSLVVQQFYPEIQIVAGMNLPLVLECMIKCDLESAKEIVETVAVTGKEAVQILRNIDQEDDGLDDLMNT